MNDNFIEHFFHFSSIYLSFIISNFSAFFYPKACFFCYNVKV
ncbi:hypothetical protein N596_05460 [Streptococcus ilei]|nr:hypothetical protein N596_05460 [Streptococcus ilei]